MDDYHFKSPVVDNGIEFDFVTLLIPNQRKEGTVEFFNDFFIGA